jgi:hypothetical protein
VRALVAPALAILALGGSSAAQPPDFWTHWGDGKAELNGYRLVQPRYGAKRKGTAVLIFVTEDMSDSLRVKADEGKHPASDVYPVMKLNLVRDFQTGIYDYNVLTSTFARVAAGWPVAKVSFSSQEWCGQVYHQLLPRKDRIEMVSHSYFDGEADKAGNLPLPADGLFEDVLPIVLRGWQTSYLEPGQKRTVPLLPSLSRVRLLHRPLAWGKATISRAPEISTVRVPAGTFEVVTWTVATEGGSTTLYQFEAKPPFRLVRWASDDGEEGALLGSTRLAYWKLNAPGGESYLRALGLRAPR